MTDVSTYIEAEDYATNFHEKYYSCETRPKLENYTTIYIDSPRVFTPNTCTSSSIKNTTDSEEQCKTS
jgi:hypothetical protein